MTYVLEIINDVSIIVEVTTYIPPNNVEYQKTKLREFFKSPIPTNPIDAYNIDLRLLYKTTIVEEEYKKINDIINSQSTYNPPKSIALIGPPGCGKVFVYLYINH